MWLINTTTLELRNFLDARNAPPYAILSHCWGKTEMNFQDFRKKRNCTGPGYQKIVDGCRIAREGSPSQRSRRLHGGFDWMWIDTVCIDKRSSAELSEAINSMFLWYGNAAMCFAHLDDTDIEGKSSQTELEAHLSQSRWFTRGWSKPLQELIAPRRMVFLDKYWHTICDKHAPTHKTRQLLKIISNITEIPIDVLRFLLPVDQCSVAQRMSWASKRKTSREEDMAYCLLGLFNLNMPLLYGEGGATAFQRLQHAILSQNNDESIYAWSPYGDHWYSDVGSMLAPSPARFASAGTIKRWRAIRCPVLYCRDSAWTLEISSDLSDPPIAFRHRVRSGNFVVRLRCTMSREGREASACVLILRQLECGHLLAAREALSEVDPTTLGLGIDSRRMISAVGGKPLTEDDIPDPGEWEPLQGSRTFLIHKNFHEIESCARITIFTESHPVPLIRLRLGKQQPLLVRQSDLM